MESLQRDMLDTSPGVTWDDIAGLAEAKRLLQENVILPLILPEYFQGIRRPVKVCSPARSQLQQHTRQQGLVCRVFSHVVLRLCCEVASRASAAP